MYSVRSAPVSTNGASTCTSPELQKRYPRAFMDQTRGRKTTQTQNQGPKETMANVPFTSAEFRCGSGSVCHT